MPTQKPPQYRTNKQCALVSSQRGRATSSSSEPLGGDTLNLSFLRTRHIRGSKGQRGSRILGGSLEEENCQHPVRMRRTYPPTDISMVRQFFLSPEEKVKPIAARRGSPPQKTAALKEWHKAHAQAAQRPAEDRSCCGRFHLLLSTWRSGLHAA